jgi:hypothetical protein
MEQVLRKDLIAGTFTHRTKYLPWLLDSWRDYCSDVPFIVQIAQQPILENFMALRETFIKSGKRFWLFLDDDIEFVSRETLSVALTTLLQTNAGMVGCYSTFKRHWKSEQPLPTVEVTWVPGYFQLVDSWKVGKITPALDLPDHNTAIDTTYCVNILLAGHKIFLAPSYVYHTYKNGSWLDKDAYEKTNEFLSKRYGSFYFEKIGVHGNIIGPIPTLEEHVSNVRLDKDAMWDNRNRLILWQEQHRKEIDPKKINLHLGCGGVHLDGYVNVDQFDASAADEQFDITILQEKYVGQVSEICCHHVIEHLRGKCIKDVCKQWFQYLIPGGLLELGTPDLELCAAGLCVEPNNFEYWEDRFYGGRTDDGQYHLQGFSKASLTAALTDAGFEIVEMYNYDANGMAPSIFILARRPE